MASPIPVALIDADVIVSSRHRRDIHSLALRGLIVACWSPWIVEEATRAIAYNWYRRNGFTDDARRRLSAASKPAMQALTGAFRVVDPKPPYPPLWPGADPGDAHVFAAAAVANADHVVSNNTRDFPPRPASGNHEWGGIVYLTPAEFLERILD